MNVRSSRHGKLGLKVGLTVGATVGAAAMGVGLVGATAAQAAVTPGITTGPSPTAHPAADYWELWDDDIPTTSPASTKARPWS